MNNGFRAQEPISRTVSDLPQDYARVVRRAAWLYVWLFFSVFVVVPWMNTNLNPLSQASDYASGPSWAPDGRQLIFVSNPKSSNQYSVIQINADGSDPRLLVTMSSDTKPYATWSPDGRHIAYIASDRLNRAIYLISANGSDHRRLADHVWWETHWSPDARQMAFEAWLSPGPGGPDVIVANADGSGLTRITEHLANARFAAWSPDSAKIVVESSSIENYELYVVNADGSNLMLLTSDLEYHDRVAWSPDSRRIAFASRRDGDYEIHVIGVDGSDLTQLTDNSADDELPAYSPDGQRIVFLSNRDDNQEVYVMNADGSHQIRLTYDLTEQYSLGRPVWSPNGQQIAFIVDVDSGQHIYIMNADGSNVKRLTDALDLQLHPVWSPTSQQIAFESESDVYTISTDGSGLRNLTPTSSIAAFVQAVIVPFLADTVLLFGLVSSNLFLRRHAQQALILVGAQAFVTFVFMGLWRTEGFWLWLIIGGSVWLFGTIWGLRQVTRGECWLMRIGQGSPELPRSADSVERPALPARRGWRALNAAVLSFAFFAPWFNGCAGVPILSGFDIVVSPVNVSLFVLVARPDATILLAIGIVGVIVYTLANAVIVVLRAFPALRHMLVLSLGASVIGLFGHLPIAVSIGSSYAFSLDKGLHRIAWGYWLILLALVSSTILEITVSRTTSRRVANSTELPP